MAAGTIWKSALVSLFGIKRRWFGVGSFYLRLLDVVLSDAAKDLFLANWWLLHASFNPPCIPAFDTEKQKGRHY